MKKNLKILQVDEISLVDIIKLLWREKILILSITIICGLAAHLYARPQHQNSITKIQLNNPPSNLFEPYNYYLFNNKNNNNNNNNNNIYAEFISDFKFNFLSLDNLQSFTEESKKFDNFNEYLKSRNISARQYFKNKIGEEKEKNLIIPSTYFLIFTKELDGDIFLNNYVEFIKSKTVFEAKKKLKSSLVNKIDIMENALEKSKIINLEYPIIRSMNQNQVINEPEDLFYKGSKILTQEIYYLKKLLIKLENEQFDYEFISQKPLNSLINERTGSLYFQLGLLLGLFLSLGIIFFKHILRNN